MKWVKLLTPAQFEANHITQSGSHYRSQSYHRFVTHVVGHIAGLARLAMQGKQQ